MGTLFAAMLSIRALRLMTPITARTFAAKLDPVLCTMKATASGGREGIVTAMTGNGNLRFKLEKPEGAMAGKGGATNPEELFACGYAACFDGALNLMLSNGKISHTGTMVTCSVDLGKVPDGVQLAAALDVQIAGVSNEEAQEFADQAHAFCPYSKAVSGNIDVTVKARGVTAVSSYSAP